jgi:hypothetical protein
VKVPVGIRVAVEVVVKVDVKVEVRVMDGDGVTDGSGVAVSCGLCVRVRVGVAGVGDGSTLAGVQADRIKNIPVNNNRFIILPCLFIPFSRSLYRVRARAGY